MTTPNPSDPKSPPTGIPTNPPPLRETPRADAKSESSPTGVTSPEKSVTLKCAFGIIVGFFAPWVTLGDTQISGYMSINPEVPTTLLVAGIPLLALATILVHLNQAARQRLGTITGIATWAGVLFVFNGIRITKLPTLDWGVYLTLLSGLGIFIASGNRCLVLPVDLVAKKLNSRKAEVFSHWGSMTPDIHFSTQDFYTNVEAAIRVKQWPGVQLLRVDYREAGLLSHKREYLRIIRQRQLFDVCAATFGTDYFFSLREAEIPAVVDGRAVIAMLLGLYLLFMISFQLCGLFFGSFVFLVLLLFGFWFLFNINRFGLTRLDSALLTFPVLGPVYEAWFRRDTYFQQDTRIVFLQCVAELVKQHVAETTSAGGLKFLHCFEKKPILDGLYKPSVMTLNPGAK